MKQLWVAGIFLLRLFSSSCAMDLEIIELDDKQEISNNTQVVVNDIINNSSALELPLIQNQNRPVHWKICRGLGFVAGKSISCFNKNNRSTEECCSACSCCLMSTSLLWSSAIGGFSGIALLCSIGSECSAENLIAFNVGTWGAVGFYGCIACIAGTYVCCDQCCGCQACPEGFREGYVCYPDHTCGPAGCSSFAICCDKAGSGCLNIFQCIYGKTKSIWVSYIQPIFTQCRSKCSDAFNLEK